MAKARPIPDLSPQEPYAVAAARILAVRANELLEHSEGVLDLDDIERVHAMRVATRRLRATLEVFEPCFPGEAHAAVLAEVKELADALGERRDRDVAIASLESFSEQIPAPDRRGVASLVDALRVEQAQANEELRPHVDRERVEGLRDRLLELTGDRRLPEEAEPSVEPAAVQPQQHGSEAALARDASGNGLGSIR